MKLRIEHTLEQLTQLQAALGVRAEVKLPELDWEALEGDGIEVDGAEIEVDREGILRYRGQVVATYIRRQYTPPEGDWSNYKFHISECTTIRSMKREGRGDRYTVTSRQDGWFSCDVEDWYSKENESRLLRMQLCKNCLRLLAPRRYSRMSHNEREQASRTFDLATYHYTFQNVGHSKPVAPPPPSPPRPSTPPSAP